MLKIIIAKDFSETPGARHYYEGEFSGEQFREEVLIPYYLKAIENSEKLVIDLDGCYGFATSFLEESFGGLVRKLKQKGTLKNMQIICTDDFTLVKLIEEYVKDAEDRL